MEQKNQHKKMLTLSKKNLFKNRLENNQKFSVAMKQKKQNANQSIMNTEFGIMTDSSLTHKQYLQQLIHLCMKNGKKNEPYKMILKALYRLSLEYSKTTNREGLLVIQQPGKQIDKDFFPHGKLLSIANNPSSIQLIRKAIEQVKPVIEVKKVRISGSTQLVPSIIPKNRQINIAIRWLKEAATARYKTKKNTSLEQCFVAELIEASQNMGPIRKKRDDLHKLAESNRGFAHYRWWNR